MKIIGIGANYYPTKDQRGEPPGELMIFSKPPTALAGGARFEYPACSRQVFYEMEIVLKINKRLHRVSETEASESFDELCLGIDWTAKDLQRRAKEKGWPWVFAKGFDGAAFLSEWMPCADFGDLNDLALVFEVNGEVRQQGSTAQMIASFGQIIAYTSQYMTLVPGDIVMTGTPPTPGEIHLGDHAKGYINGEKYLDFTVV